MAPKSINFEELAQKETDQKFLASIHKVEQFKNDIVNSIGGVKTYTTHSIRVPETWQNEHISSFKDNVFRYGKGCAKFELSDTLEEKVTSDGRKLRTLVAKSPITDGHVVRDLFTFAITSPTVGIDREYNAFKGVKSKNKIEIGINFSDVNSGKDFDMGKAGFFGYFFVSDINAKESKKTGRKPPMNLNLFYNIKNLPKGLKVRPVGKPENCPEKVFMNEFAYEGKNGTTLTGTFAKNAILVAFELLGYEKGWEVDDELDKNGNPKKDKNGNIKTHRVEMDIPKYGYKTWFLNPFPLESKDGKQVSKPIVGAASGIRVGHLELVIAEAIGKCSARLAEESNLIDVVIALENAVERCADINNPPTEKDESGLFVKAKDSNTIGDAIAAAGKDIPSVDDDEEEDGNQLGDEDDSEESGEEAIAEETEQTETEGSDEIESGDDGEPVEDADEDSGKDENNESDGDVVDAE